MDGACLALAHAFSNSSLRSMQTNQLTKYTAYHFHNFFDDMGQIRHKYRTYGHAMKNAYDLPLEAMNNDLNFTVKCAMERDDTVFGNRRQRVMGGFDAIVGPKPIYFREQGREWRAKWP